MARKTARLYCETCGHRRDDHYSDGCRGCACTSSAASGHFVADVHDWRG